MSLGMFFLRETKNWSFPYTLDQDISGKQGDPRSSATGFWRVSPYLANWSCSVLKSVST